MLNPVIIIVSMSRYLSVIFCFFFAASLSAQNAHDEWLKTEGYYLLTPEQKEEFKNLSDLEKAIYIKNIWDAMDPDPLTPENEFKAEYQKRVAHAKKRYGIPSDRAKIYILLGPPNAIDSHPNSDQWYPLELWSYYSLGYRGLPPSLELIFFKRWGAGDYRLYSPIFDGFKALTPSNMDFDDPRLRGRIRAQFDPQIIEASQRVSIGATRHESEVVRSTLQDPRALRRFVAGGQRPNVETTVVYEGFGADVYTYSSPHEPEVYRTSIAIAVPPQYLTFENDQEIYSARFDLTGHVLDEQGNQVLELKDSPAVRLNGPDFEKVKSFHFSYLFNAYLLPGKYKFDCLFRDYASNAAGKIEKDFEVMPVSGDLELLPPLLAYKRATAPHETAPFAFGPSQFFPKENYTFNNDHLVYIFTSVQNPKHETIDGLWKLDMTLTKDGKNVVEGKEDYAATSTTGNLNLERRLQLSSLPPGDYLLTVRLSQGDVTLTSQSPLRISAQKEVIGRIRVVPDSVFSPESYHTNLALQFLNKKDLEQASKHVRIALDFAPSSNVARALQARIQKEGGDVDAAIQLYEKLLAENPTDSEGFFLVGMWHVEKRDWMKASDMLKKALAAGYYTTELLNLIARAELQMGNKAQAVEYWEKSLALNANQPDIQQELQTNKQQTQ